MWGNFGKLLGDFGDFRPTFGGFWGILRRSLGTSGIIYSSRWVPKSRTKLTRTLWYTLGTAHDFESKRLQSARSFFISVFAAHQAQLAIIFLWSAIPLVQIAWQGDFEQWVSNPRGHPHRALDSFINHHLGGFLGTASVAWAGHLVHVALPASRGQSTDWSNLLHQLPHPAGLKPFVTLEWGLYSTNGDQWNHVFGLADASVGTSVLSFLGTRMPSSDSLWLADVDGIRGTLGRSLWTGFASGLPVV